MSSAIQVILVVAVITAMVLFWGRSSSRSRAIMRLLALAFAAFAIVAIIWPDVTNKLANLVGVGRGADLLLYSLVVVVVFGFVNQSLARRRDQARLARVVRAHTLLQASLDYPPGAAPCPRQLTPPIEETPA